MREKCQYLGLFWSTFSRIRTECREIRSISPYSVRMRENADQNSSEYGHLLISLKSAQSNTEDIIRKIIPSTREANIYKDIQTVIFTETMQDIFSLIFQHIRNGDVSLIKQGFLILALILE